MGSETKSLPKIYTTSLSPLFFTLFEITQITVKYIWFTLVYLLWSDEDENEIDLVLSVES